MCIQGKAANFLKLSEFDQAMPQSHTAEKINEFITDVSVTMQIWFGGSSCDTKGLSV